MRKIADAERAFSPDTLPGQLGLSQEQAKAAQDAIEEAFAGPVTMKELLGALKAVLYGLDDDEISGAIESVTREMANWEQLLYIGIAYRAFAKGFQAAQAEPEQEESPA